MRKKQKTVEKICACYQEESLMLGEEVTLKILEIRGKQVTLGITAPKELRILREEIIKKNKP